MPAKEIFLKIGYPEEGGFAGVNYSPSENKLKRNQTPKCYNYLVNKKGLVTRKGSLSQNVVEIPGTGPVLGMLRFYDGTEYHTLAKRNSSLYDVFNIETPGTLIAGLSENEIFFDRWLGNYFFIDNKVLYSGSQEDLAPVAVPLCDQEGNPLTGEKPFGTIPVLHNGRIWWIGGHSTPFFSEVDYYDRYLTLDDPTLLACSIACDNGDGQDIVAGLSYNGKLILWKREKMFFVTGDWDELNGTIPEVTMYTNTGLYNQKGVIKCGDGYIRGYGPDGVFEYSDATGLRFVSDDISDRLNQIAFEVRDKICVAWNDGLFLMFYPWQSECNNACLAYSPTSGDWLSFESWNIACVTRFEDDWLYGACSDVGRIKKLFEGYSDDNATIATYYETKFIILPEEYYIDTITAGINNGDGEVKLTWICDTANSASIIKSASPIPGFYRLADENRPDLGGFLLADEADLKEDEHLLIDSVTLTSNFSEYRARIRPGQRFKKIKFIFESNSLDEHQIDYVSVKLILARVV